MKSSAIYEYIINKIIVHWYNLLKNKDYWLHATSSALSLLYILHVSVITNPVEIKWLLWLSFANLLQTVFYVLTKLKELQ